MVLLVVLPPPPEDLLERHAAFSLLHAGTSILSSSQEGPLERILPQPAPKSLGDVCIPSATTVSRPGSLLASVSPREHGKKAPGFAIVLSSERWSGGRERQEDPPADAAAPAAEAPVAEAPAADAAAAAPVHTPPHVAQPAVTAKRWVVGLQTTDHLSGGGATPPR